MTCTCGHEDSHHSTGGWNGTRCLAYPGPCDCIAYQAESSGYDLLESRDSELEELA
jgi:hypothetical protein